MALHKNGKLFIVQIKVEIWKTGRKDFMSVFKKGAEKKKASHVVASENHGPEVLSIIYL